MSKSRDPYKIHYTDIVHETDAAELIDFPEGEMWIPKSQISDRSSEGDAEPWIEIPEWLAYEKGLL